MAINYQAMTTATGASAVAATNVMLDALKSVILANPAWTLVEDADVGSTPYRWLAFKCSAASSGLPNDFYVLFTSSRTVSNVLMFMGEGYTPATHTMTNVAPLASGNTYALDSTGRHPSPTQVAPLATGAPTATGTNPNAGYGLSVAATTVYWQAIVSESRLVFASGITAAGTASFCMYFGAFTPVFSAAVEPYPIVSGLANGSSSAALSSTREPAVAGLVNTSRTTCLSVCGLSGTAWTLEYYRGASYGSVDLYQGGGVTPSRALVFGSVAGSISLRGVFVDVVVFASNPTGAAMGDTVLYNGTYWALFFSTFWVNTGVAGP